MNSHDVASGRHFDEDAYNCHKKLDFIADCVLYRCEQAPCYVPPLYPSYISVRVCCPFFCVPTVEYLQQVKSSTNQCCSPESISLLSSIIILKQYTSSPSNSIYAQYRTKHVLCMYMYCACTSTTHNNIAHTAD